MNNRVEYIYGCFWVVLVDIVIVEWEDVVEIGFDRIDFVND